MNETKSQDFFKSINIMFDKFRQYNELLDNPLTDEIKDKIDNFRIEFRNFDIWTDSFVKLEDVNLIFNVPYIIDTDKFKYFCRRYFKCTCNINEHYLKASHFKLRARIVSDTITTYVGNRYHYAMEFTLLVCTNTKLYNIEQEGGYLTIGKYDNFVYLKEVLTELSNCIVSVDQKHIENDLSESFSTLQDKVSEFSSLVTMLYESGDFESILNNLDKVYNDSILNCFEKLKNINPLHRIDIIQKQ